MSTNIITHPFFHIFKKNHVCPNYQVSNSLSRETIPRYGRGQSSRIIAPITSKDRNMTKTNGNLQQEYAKSLLLITQI